MKITIINSKDHWIHGWFASRPELEFVIKILQKAGIEVTQVEVENLVELEKALDMVSEDTLIWSNAYFVNDPQGKLVWISERIESRELPFVGSGFQSLQQVLKKDSCQTILAKHQLSIPSFLAINRENISRLEYLIREKNIELPFVLKPTAESGSIGIRKANTLEEAKHFASKILQSFPSSDVLLEEFLPNDDITCGFLEMGNEIMLLPTYYIVKNKPSHRHILSREERLLSWDGVNKIQPPVSDLIVLNQLKTEIPKVVKALDIKGITRIDGRQDKSGCLRFFDVNGLPALYFPDGVMVKQCMICFSDYPPKQVFEGLIYTVVHHAFVTYNMELPTWIQQNHLFNLQSDKVVKKKKMSDLIHCTLNYLKF